MRRLLDGVLAVIAGFVLLKVALASVGALLVGLYAASFAATAAGALGLVITVMLWRWVNELLDLFFHPLRAL